ncbi:MAG: hypothetical protein AUI87_05380 [Actinobacteria bacterium 13_1_40CM_3_66_19]|nr:MAG: hypothetical protein AUI87_05380 [Actinobacteria bacterium 13_1_40CM_3_66_19]
MPWFWIFSIASAKTSTKHDLAPPQGARHKAFERALGSLVEERDDRDHKNQKEHHEADEGGAEVIERVVVGAAIEVLDLRLKADVAPVDLRRKRGHRLLQRLDDRGVLTRLRSFEVYLR